MEVWKQIPSLPLYEASSLGRIRKADTILEVEGSLGRKSYTRFRAGRILTPKMHDNGYLTVRVNPGDQTKMVSRLVCEAFKGPAPSDAHEADHENRVRDDNRPENLFWLTLGDNRAKRVLPRGEQHFASPFTVPQIVSIRERAVLAVAVTAFDRETAAELGVSREAIRNIRLRKSWDHVA